MSGINLRKRSRVTYYEPPEPSIDDYIFCDYCSDYVYENCTLHGPLLDLPDDRVTAKKLSCSPEDIHRANLTLPHVFLYIAPSSIPGAGLGVFAKLTLPKDIRFGPYKGTLEDKTNISLYSWQLYKNGKAANTVDGKDVDKSNWMRFVNCARIWFEQNLLAYQYRGQIYYRTIRIVPRDTELLVFYGSEYANLLGINLYLYNLTKTIGSQDKLYKIIEKYDNTEVKKQEIYEKRNKIDIATESLPQDLNNNQVNTNIQQIINTTNSQDNNSDEINKAKKIKVSYNEKHKKVFICDYCNKCFECKTILEAHITLHVDKITNNKKKSHNKINKKLLPMNNDVLKTHDANKPYQCNLCSYKCKQSVDLKRHLRTHTGEKPYQCNLCSYKCTQNSALKKHLLTHTGEKPYQCNLCSYKCKQSVDLKRHLRTHTGEKPYQCNLCSYKCTQNSALKKHLLTHTGEKPYQCNLCSYKCTVSSHLKGHLRTHTGEKPYQCNLCSYKCTQNSALKKHLLTHTGEKPYQCNLCSYKCTVSSHLKRHLLTHTGEKLHQCNLCSYKCITSTLLKSHVKRKHDISKTK